MQIIRIQLKIKNIDKWNNSKCEYSFLKRLKLIKEIIKNETKTLKYKNKILFLFPAGMFKKSSKGSGVFYYVRNGLARTSYYTASKVFSSAVFENKNFNSYRSGVNIKQSVTRSWKYEENNLEFKSIEKNISNFYCRLDENIIANDKTKLGE